MQRQPSQPIRRGPDDAGQTPQASAESDGQTVALPKMPENMTPEQRRQWFESLTPEQRDAMRAQRGGQRKPRGGPTVRGTMAGTAVHRSNHVQQVSAQQHASAADTNRDLLVELHDIHKIYHMGSATVHALNGVDLQIERGGFWAIMGPSGSGKSTMLNLLGCLDHPTSGRYILNGHDVSVLDDDALSAIRLRELGFVFQSFNLVPQLTVAENIELPLYYQGWQAQASRARSTELAEMVGLGDRLLHRPGELSGGQQQRVAVARSLANDPAVLLADEPTGNLDSATGQQIMELLTELNDAGKTIILVTHEPDIAAYARHQLHMLDGKIDRIEGRA